MKNIDAEKLIAEIKRYKNKADERLKIKGRTFSEEQKDIALQNLCGNLLHFIDSLQQEQREVDLVAELKHHLATTPKEQLEKEWKELEPWGNIGPTVQEFLYGKQPEVDLEKEAQDEYYKYAYYESGSISGEGYHLEAQGTL